MNIRLSLLAFLIFVSPLYAAQEEQSANVKNRIRTAVITIGSIVAGAFLAYLGYRYFGTARKVNESVKSEDNPAKEEKNKSCSIAPKEEKQKNELSDEQREVLEQMLADNKERTKEMEALVNNVLEQQNQTT